MDFETIWNNQIHQSWLKKFPRKSTRLAHQVWWRDKHLTPYTILKGIFVQIWRMLVLGVFKMQCFLPQTKHVQVMQGENVLNPDSSAVFHFRNRTQSRFGNFQPFSPFSITSDTIQNSLLRKISWIIYKKNIGTQWVNMASLNQLRLSAEFCPEVLLSVETS